MLRLLLVVALVAAWPALAQLDWRSLAYPLQGFAVEFPDAPKETHGSGTDRVLGTSDYTYETHDGREVLSVMVMEYLRRVPDPEERTTALLKRQASFLKCNSVKIRDAATPGGRFKEARLDDCYNQSSWLIREAIFGTHAYRVTAGGPAGYDRDADARHFVESFTLRPLPQGRWRLLIPPADWAAGHDQPMQTPFSLWVRATQNEFADFAGCQEEGGAQGAAALGEADETVRILNAVCFNTVTRELRTASPSGGSRHPPVDVPGVAVDDFN